MTPAYVIYEIIYYLRFYSLIITIKYLKVSWWELYSSVYHILTS